MTLAFAAVIVVGAVYALIKKVDIRLTLLLAALALGTVAGDPMAIVRTFLVTFSKEQFVVPLCCAMGFAYVLRHTGCDQHLVQLLLRPLRRARTLLIPGVAVVGFLVNVPVISQTSTAVALGAVAIPLLRAAQISPVTSGAALLLGTSIGGELLNPGAPELRTVATALGIDSALCVRHNLPLVCVAVPLAVAVFWPICLRAEAKYRQAPDVNSDWHRESVKDVPAFRVNLVKALVPLVPLALLFLVSPPFEVLGLPRNWLVDVDSAADRAAFSSRLIGAAMLVGAVAAALASPGRAGGTVGAFFEGAGYAFTYIIALIVTATCFGKGIELIGVAEQIGRLTERLPNLLLPVAAGLSWGFGLLSGSGMAATQSLFGFFVEPSQAVGMDPVHVGAVVSLAAAAGRTMSPVSAVGLMCARLTDTDPLALARRVAIPLFVGLAGALVLAIATAGTP
jgi:C4-dicarboxylate transporter, DcuC family